MAKATEIILELSKIKEVREQIRSLNTRAWEIRRSYPKEALELSLKARILSENDNYREGIAQSYLTSGASYYLMSQYHQALIDLEKAQAFFEQDGNEEAMASTLRNIGNVYHSMSLFELSIECYNTALVITRKREDIQGTAYNLGNIGIVYQKMGKNDLAKSYFLDSAILLDQIKDVVGNADLLNNFGNLYISEGNSAQGMLMIRESLSVSTSIDHIRGMATAHKSLGSQLIKTAIYEEALKELHQAEDLAREMNELVVITEILQQLSEAYEKNGDFKQALHYHRDYEKHKSELQQISQSVLLEAFRMKAEAEHSYLEKEYYKKENAELEKARLEIQLKNVELERLSIVASETENSILILDPDGTLQWVNPSFERLNGCTLKEFKEKFGKTIYQVSNNPEIKNIIRKAIKSRKSVNYESPNHLDNGTTVWESSTLTPIFNSEGVLNKLIIIDQNVTDRKENEEIIRQKNKDITDRIKYASYFQDAIMPLQDSINNIFPDSFILFKPKDIVSGDFYWFSATHEVGMIAAADCTGHGVPGAFMSVIGNELLSNSLHDASVRCPSAALTMLDKKIKNVFRKGRQETLAQDGMDIGLLVWHFKDNLIQFSGAKRPLILVRDKEVFEYQGDRFSIGGNDLSAEKSFTDKEFTTKKGDVLYLFTDGYTDQFGGKQGKKFMYRQFVELLSSVSSLPGEQQKERINKAFNDWKGKLDQVDDVLVIGIKIP
jgi:PAS domain S-box-containing protein